MAPRSEGAVNMSEREWNWWETGEYPPEGEYTGFQDTVPMGAPACPIEMTELEGIEYQGARYVLRNDHWYRLVHVAENHWDGEFKRSYYMYESMTTPRILWEPVEDVESVYNFKGWADGGKSNEQIH